MENITLFSQIISKLDRSKLDRSKFSKIVARKETDRHNKGFSSWNHLIPMLFCQFAKSQSVRDITNGFRSATRNLNHLGISKAPSKSSISYQNKNRLHELFKKYYFELLQSLGQYPRFKQVKFRINSNIFYWTQLPSVYLIGQNTREPKGLLKCIHYLILMVICQNLYQYYQR